jgi:hypothetical protein
MGRKNTQVKVRGQHIEPEEVEYHLRRCFQCLKEVAVELVRRKGPSGNASLVAFICRDDHWEQKLHNKVNGE